MSISSKTAEMIVKQLIYDSCMIVKKETVMPICYDVQVIYKKHDSMIVVSLFNFCGVIPYRWQ